MREEDHTEYLVHSEKDFQREFIQKMMKYLFMIA